MEPNYYQEIPFLHDIFDIETGRSRRVFEGFKVSDSAAWSADSKTLYATGLYTGDRYMYAFIRVLRTLDIPSGREQVVDLKWDRGLLYGAGIIPLQDGFMALVEDGCHPKLMKYVKSERDTNVPAAMVRITFRGIQKYGQAPVELYIFPGEPHVLQRLSHQRRKMFEEQRWFDKYLFDKK